MHFAPGACRNRRSTCTMKVPRLCVLRQKDSWLVAMIRQVAHSLILPSISSSHKVESVTKLNLCPIHRGFIAMSGPRSRPLRLDFNRSSNSGRIMVEAAPLVVSARCHQSTLHRVAVDIADHFAAGYFAWKPLCWHRILVPRFSANPFASQRASIPLIPTASIFTPGASYPPDGNIATISSTPPCNLRY